MLPRKRSSPVPVNFPPWGVTVLESRHAANFSMEQVRWDFWVMLYVIGGRGCLVTERATMALEMDGMVLIPPREPYRLVDEAGAPLWLSVICLEHALLDRLQVVPDGCRRYLPGSKDRSSWRNRVRELIATVARDEPHAAIGVVAQTLALLWEVLSSDDANGPGGTAAERVRAYVNNLPQHVHRADNIDEIAASLGMSRRRFTQLFRQVTGTTWLRYIHRLRLDHACRLLRESDRSIRVIIFESGFDDPAGFYRAFRKAFGATPGEWRATAQARVATTPPAPDDH